MRYQGLKEKKSNEVGYWKQMYLLAVAQMAWEEEIEEEHLAHTDSYLSNHSHEWSWRTSW